MCDQLTHMMTGNHNAVIVRLPGATVREVQCSVSQCELQYCMFVFAGCSADDSAVCVLHITLPPVPLFRLSSVHDQVARCFIAVSVQYQLKCLQPRGGRMLYIEVPYPHFRSWDHVGHHMDPSPRGRSTSLCGTPGGAHSSAVLSYDHSPQKPKL